MTKLIIKNSGFPEDALFDLLNRDAALWVCGFESDSLDEWEKLAQFMVLPWKVVLSELSSAALMTNVETHGSEQDSLSSYRGFVHMVASDPSTRQLPARALPIFLLNGRDDASDHVESSHLKGMAANRRRLNMIERLEVASPKRIVILGSNVEQASQELAELWSSEFRALLTFVVPDSVESDSIASYFESTADLSSISIVSTELRSLLDEVVRRSVDLLPDSKIIIRVRKVAGDIQEIDITDAELIEQPLLDKFDIIKSKDLQRLTEFDLTVEDLNKFFDKSEHSWRAFAAGLPWISEKRKIKTILRSLEGIHKSEASHVPVYYVISEAGAGGTTFARFLAFEAASDGFPTLLAKSHLYEPSATEVTNFLYRALLRIKRVTDSVKNDQSVPESAETPWLFVFDREQWDGQEQSLGNFAAELSRSGRPAVILKVLGPDISPRALNIDAKEICTLTHSLEREQVLSLGEHLNKFLSPLGRSKSESEWLRFWNAHKPDVETSIAAFWIILEFWLRGLIDLGESIPGWLLKQFKDAPITPDIRQVILEIAALSIERRAVPEQLLPTPQDTKLPLSVVLEELRISIPGLALIREQSTAGRRWAVAHDVLARYLITAIYYDRPLLQELELTQSESAVELRLDLISRLTRRAALGQYKFLSYADQFAVNTLKLDGSNGNAEFFQYWHKVLEMLDAFPDSVQHNSRTFIHHVAISRRRIAKNDQFQASVEESRAQLRQAIKQIKFALEDIEETNDDESNLNLYNSLALAYQDLASLELKINGVSDLVRSLLAKASEATRNALKENSTNSYVLETAAKTLLQQGKVDSSETINAAAQALGYIFQASALEKAFTRQDQLGKLATKALLLLRGDGSADEILKMKRQGNPMGYLASAWIELMSDHQIITEASSSSYSKNRARTAIGILKEAPRDWLVIRLQHDLTSFLDPYDFKEQLILLDELDSMPTYRMPLQQRLERSILLHMVGRHPDANEAFRNLRPDIKEQNAILSVPRHLRWLLQPDSQKKLLCNARVTDNLGYRAYAQVKELKDAAVPFTPQEFGQQSFPQRSIFKCHITFGAMGPFIKPIGA